MESEDDKPEVSAKPPELVFHYTTPGGLIGILGADGIQLWASHIRFMNDNEEFNYAVRYLSASIYDDLDNEMKPERQRRHLADGHKWLESDAVENVQVYACCFCPDGDLLSQWRGYGVNNGYSLGFSGDALRQQAMEYGDDLFFRVEYGHEDGAELLDAIKDAIAYDTGMPRWGLAFIKHPGFREEQEWRWVRDLENESEEGRERNVDQLPNYRTGNLGVIPYLIFTIQKEALRKVIVGPGQHSKVRAEGVRRLLASHGYGSAVVESSRIPLRL